MIELITTDGKESRIYANMATPFARARTHGVRSVTVIPVTYPRRGAASVRIVYNDGATLAADYESLSVAVAQFTRKGKRAGSLWPMPRVYEPTTFTRVYNDTNGNPRYVVHFSALLPNSPTASCYDSRAHCQHNRRAEVQGQRLRRRDRVSVLLSRAYPVPHLSRPPPRRAGARPSSGRAGARPSGLTTERGPHAPNRY